MTDRERLIELIRNAPRKDVVYGDIKLEKPVQTVQNIADHLLANGVIVPPCKVGDVVWNRKVEPHKVISIEWYSKKVMHLHCEHHTFSVGKRSLGKTVFLTKEDAEQALKEREQV